MDKIEIIRFTGATSAGTLSFKKQFIRLLRKNKVPDESLLFIEHQMDGDRSIHSTIHSKARKFFEERLRSSPYLMEYVVRMLYQDFELFGFEIPQVEFKP